MNQSIARKITFLARKSQIYLGGMLGKYNLTAAEQPFFMALQHYEGVTQEELTSLVCVDKAVTTRVVKSLEEKGFLIRVQDEKDRRQNRIYPTDKTKNLGPAVRTELLQFNRLLIQGIEPQNLDLIYEGLQKMEDNLAGFLRGKDTKTEYGEQKDGAYR